MIVILLLVDTDALRTSNMTDEELMAEVTRRKLVAHVSTELPQSKNKKKVDTMMTMKKNNKSSKTNNKKKTDDLPGPIDITQGLSPSLSKIKATSSPQGSKASFSNKEDNDSASDVHEGSLLGLIGAQQQENEPPTKSPYTLDFEPFYFESHQLEELRRQEDEAITFDPRGGNDGPVHVCVQRCGAKGRKSRSLVPASARKAWGALPIATEHKAKPWS